MESSTFLLPSLLSSPPHAAAPSSNGTAAMAASSRRRVGWEDAVSWSGELPFMMGSMMRKLLLRGDTVGGCRAARVRKAVRTRARPRRVADDQFGLQVYVGS